MDGSLNMDITKDQTHHAIDGSPENDSGRSGFHWRKTWHGSTPENQQPLAAKNVLFLKGAAWM